MNILAAFIDSQTSTSETKKQQMSFNKLTKINASRTSTTFAMLTGRAKEIDKYV
tara:strand:- start:334 stop:495 length:162 start_codon:yes stop_codon:yes gene_type:complete